MKIAMRIKLHNTAFVGGTNLQLNLDTKKWKDLKLLDDEENAVIYACYKGPLGMEVNKIPYTNVSDITHADQDDLLSWFNFQFDMAAKKPEVLKPLEEIIPQQHKAKLVFSGPADGHDPRICEGSAQRFSGHVSRVARELLRRQRNWRDCEGSARGFGF